MTVTKPYSSIAAIGDRAGGLICEHIDHAFRAITRRAVPASPVALAGCDALYIGQVPPPQARQLTDAVRGRGVLTIAEADPLCRSQAMFCMVYDPRAINFRMNIDAIARSGLRVDPRVLRLAEGGL